VNTETGIVEVAGLERREQIPVFLENDVWAAAFAEHTFGG